MFFSYNRTSNLGLCEGYDEGLLNVYCVIIIVGGLLSLA